jgi:hypothetical protein
MGEVAHAAPSTVTRTTTSASTGDGGGCGVGSGDMTSGSILSVGPRPRSPCLAASDASPQLRRMVYHAETMRSLIKVLAWLMIAFGAAGIFAEIDEARNGKTGDLGASTAVIVLFGGGGLLLLRRARRMKDGGASSEAAGPSVEQRVLAAARAQRGNVTAVSVAAEGSLTLDQAREELERLAKENACLMEVSSEGLVTFRFREFEERGAKESA